jgi:hypothetical protein
MKMDLKTTPTKTEAIKDLMMRIEATQTIRAMTMRVRKKNLNLTKGKRRRKAR